jgi:hypothetical protein
VKTRNLHRRALPEFQTAPKRIGDGFECQDERIFTGYSQVPQQKKHAFFDMDRKWLKDRGKAKVKGWQTVQQLSAFSLKVFSLKALP